LKTLPVWSQLTLDFFHVFDSPFASFRAFNVLEGADSCSQVSGGRGTESCLHGIITVFEIKALDDCFGVELEEVCVVAAFLDHNDFLAHLCELIGHPEVHHWTELAPADLVTYAAIEAAADDDDVWSELTGDWEHYTLECKLVLV